MRRAKLTTLIPIPNNINNRKLPLICFQNAFGPSLKSVLTASIFTFEIEANKIYAERSKNERVVKQEEKLINSIVNRIIAEAVWVNTQAALVFYKLFFTVNSLNIFIELPCSGSQQQENSNSFFF